MSISTMDPENDSLNHAADPTCEATHHKPKWGSILGVLEMNITLDHILWATPDLTMGCSLFQELSGVPPAPGGAHPGFGTRNALTSFSPSTYLEILAPDPSQDLMGTWGEEVAALTRPCMYSFCLACEDLEAVATNAAALGVNVQQPIAMSRKTPDGTMLNWRIMRLEDPRWAGRLPFFIDWQGSPHPGSTTTGGATLEDLYALDPDPAALRAVYRAIGCDVPVYAGAVHGLVASLQSANGRIVLT
jgi:hypothetical protein